MHNFGSPEGSRATVACTSITLLQQLNETLDLTPEGTTEAPLASLEALTVLLRKVINHSGHTYEELTLSHGPQPQH